MGLFWSSKPVVSETEFQKKVRGHLYGEGFTHNEIDRVQEIFRGDMDKDSNTYAKGITKKELDAGIKWMREHENTHHISDKKIDLLEIEMNKFI